MTVHVVGLDLSLAKTGWSIIRPGEPIRHGVLPSSAVRGDYYVETLDRLRRICARIIRRAAEGHEVGDVIVYAIEGPSHGNSNENGYHARAGLMWLLLHLLSKSGTCVVVPPSSAKRYMTGKGNADKPAMVSAVQRAFPALIVTDDNEADAITMAAMVARELGFPQEVSTHRVHPAALDGVVWPEWITQRRERA